MHSKRFWQCMFSMPLRKTDPEAETLRAAQLPFLTRRGETSSSPHCYLRQPIYLLLCWDEQDSAWRWEGKKKKIGMLLPGIKKGGSKKFLFPLPSSLGNLYHVSLLITTVARRVGRTKLRHTKNDNCSLSFKIWNLNGKPLQQNTLGTCKFFPSAKISYTKIYSVDDFIISLNTDTSLTNRGYLILYKWREGWGITFVQIKWYDNEK